MALPYINLYIGDLKKDTDLLSPAAFGSYMRLMLFHMHEAKNRGQVTFTLPQLCRIFAAENLEQTSAILKEITDPTFNICDYQETDGKHWFRNRRMVKESAISQARSEAGKIGAEKTNTKNRQNKKVAEDFAAATGAASDSANNSASNSANKGQNYNTNINNNSINNTDELNGEFAQTPGAGPRIDNGTAVFVVPELLGIFKKHKPKYIYQQDKDFPALRKIAETIADQEGVTIQNNEGIEQIKSTWESIVVFLLTDNLYKNFQLNQVEKYFQSICEKFRNDNGNAQTAVVSLKGPKPSPIQNNIAAAQGAKDMIEKKYAGGQE